MTAKVFVSGFVQNVGFRHFVLSKAKKLGVKGWVRNLPDGRVEALFQSTKDNIEQMIKFCEQGPFLSEVKNVTVNWIEEKEKLTSFEII